MFLFIESSACFRYGFQRLYWKACMWAFRDVGEPHLTSTISYGKCMQGEEFFKSIGGASRKK